MRLEINCYRIIGIQYKNNLKPNTNVEIKNNFSYNVKYAPDSTCIGTLEITMGDANSDDFFINLIVEGFFKFEKGEKQENVHRATFHEIYAHARALVIELTQKAGIPIIVLPCINIDTQSIYKYSNNQKQE